MNDAPPDGIGEIHNRIVVGVDCSDPSKDAMRWAHRQAELTGSELRVVMSWDVPTTAYWAPLPETWNLEEVTRAALEEAVKEVIVDSGSVKITTLVAKGRPALVLVDQARDADLLVVGSRGHGGFKGMLLGSVSEHCATHADCPVVIVRHPFHRD
jgi:nucleotide-binding universal stress UspA family protein